MGKRKPSAKKKRQRISRLMNGRTRPGDIRTHERMQTPVDIKTIRDMIRTRPWFSTVASGSMALAASAYIEQSQLCMARTLQALNNVGADHDPQSVIGCSLSAEEIDALRSRRAEWMHHMQTHLPVQLRAPPSAGGDTARFTLGTGLWVLITHANSLIRALRNRADLLWSFDPSRSRFLTANLLVLDTMPVLSYPLSLLVQTIYNLLTRFETLPDFHSDIAVFVQLLEHRVSEFICGSGVAADGFDSLRWLEPASRAARDMARSSAAQVVTTDFVCRSMLWFMSLRHFIDVHKLLSTPYPTPNVQLRDDEQPMHFNVAQTRAMSWFPNEGMLARLRLFFNDYATHIIDDRYEIAMRAYLMLFIPLPCESDIFRLYNQADLAIPRNVLDQPAAHRSTTGADFIKHVQFRVPVIEWAHDAENFKSGDTHVRSAALERCGFLRELAMLYIVHQFLAGSKVGLNFRRRFVLFQRASTFFPSYVKCKRNGWPFIVQNCGIWSVIFPHPKHPDEDARDIERSMESISTRDARATEQFVNSERRKVNREERSAAMASARASMAPADLNALESTGGSGDGDSDDDSSSGSYTYSYEEDDEASVSAVEQGATRVHLDKAASANNNGNNRSGDDDDDSASDSGDFAALDKILYGPLPDGVPDTEDERLAQQMSRLTVECQQDEQDDDPFKLEQRRIHGAHFAQQAPARDEFLRVYDCASFLEAFAMWTVGLIHINKGRIDKRNFSDLFSQIYGWTDAL